MIALKLKKDYTKLVILFFFFLFFLDIFLKTFLIYKTLFITYLIIVIFITLIFNYYLTKKPIVIYNKKIFLGLRLITIPIEDFLYGINLIYLSTIIYEFFLNF